MKTLNQNSARSEFICPTTHTNTGQGGNTGEIKTQNTIKNINNKKLMVSSLCTSVSIAVDLLHSYGWHKFRISYKSIFQITLIFCEMSKGSHQRLH
jgi:hypothetical protein